MAGPGLIELFSHWVRETPEALCLAHGDQRLTYAEVDVRSTRVGRALQRRGCRAGSVVGLLAHQGVDLVVAAIGIIKAGGAYLPIHPGTPPDRMRFMLSDCGARLVIAAPEATQLAHQADNAVVFHLDSASIAVEDGEPLATARGNGDVTYVIYTSGSTGTPKGIAVPDHAVRRLVVDTDYVSLGQRDRIAQASNPAFDAATFEIWGALLNGASLHVLPEETLLSPAALRRFLAAERVNVLFLTTALFNHHAREAPDLFAGLDALLFGGEACDARAVRSVLTAGRPARLLHVYGPTETTTFATFHLVVDVPADAITIPIGKPIAGTIVYVLDDALSPVPDGEPGEIVIGGEGVALGYVARPDLTAAHFVADPFSAQRGARMYRTGDRGRRLPSGDVEFLGRLDHQVKLRGFRIELGEVEAALRKLPEVRDAVVVTREDRPGDRRLVAYVTVADATARQPALLAHALGELLPSYMVPSTFVVLDKLPLNANGKIDRTALPTPAPVVVAADAPRGFVATQVAEIWAEVLGLPVVGANDNFFALGGHSLLAAQVIARTQARLGVAAPLRTLFEAATLADWAATLECIQLDEADAATLAALLDELEDGTRR